MDKHFDSSSKFDKSLFVEEYSNRLFILMRMHGLGKMQRFGQFSLFYLFSTILLTTRLKAVSTMEPMW